MITRKRELTTNSDAQLVRLIETIRWHTIRYDNLRASLANRASFVVSVDAVLIAGVSFLFSWIARRSIFGGKATLIVLGCAMLLALVFALLSVRQASRALLSSKSWRKLFEVEPPPSLVYQHSDTIKVAPSYTEFSATLRKQSLNSEVEAATVNLWLVLHTHAYRYRFLRRATNELQVAILAFAGSAILAVTLGLIA